MTVSFIEVLRPGALTTVQDLGRVGWQSEGVTVGGSMDRFAASIANILAGNAPELPLLESTILGPTLQFHGSGYIALTGADISAKLNGKRIDPWSSTPVNDGDILTFGSRITGARTYLAVYGGIEVPLVLGSGSTDIRGKFGGCSGRPIAAGDRLNVGALRHAPLSSVRRLMSEDLMKFRPSLSPIRVLRNVRDDKLSAGSWETFLNTEYFVQPESDRMGYRLSGTPLSYRDGPTRSTHSEPTCVGTIQVPPNGQPIVLMADRQTVGGYPIIGTLVTVDVGRLAQIAPSEPVSFEQVTLHCAQDQLIAERNFLRLLKAANC